MATAVAAAASGQKRSIRVRQRLDKMRMRVKTQ
jgi:hypothetical protein